MFVRLKKEGEEEAGSVADHQLDDGLLDTNQPTNQSTSKQKHKLALLLISCFFVGISKKKKTSSLIEERGAHANIIHVCLI